MKRFIGVFLGVFSLVFFCACWNYINVPVSGDLFYEQDGEKACLIWDERRYYVYGGTNTRDLVGDRIGAVNGDEQLIVYMVKGYNSEDWLMMEINAIMSRGMYVVYMNEFVQEIPEVFELVGDSDTHLKYYMRT